MLSHCEHDRNCEGNNSREENLRNPPYVCKICNATHANRSAFKKHFKKQHLTILNADDVFVCKICGHSYRDLTPIMRHVMTHADGITFRCKSCPYAATYMSRMRSHFETEHIGTKEVQCSLCGSTIGGQKKNHLAVCPEARKKIVNAFQEVNPGLQCNFLQCDICHTTRAKARCMIEHSLSCHFQP